MHPRNLAETARTGREYVDLSQDWILSPNAAIGRN